MVSAGWLVLPAKQTDLENLETKVQTIETDVKATKDSVNRMNNTVNDLVILVKGIDNQVRSVEIPLPRRRK